MTPTNVMTSLGGPPAVHRCEAALSLDDEDGNIGRLAQHPVCVAVAGRVRSQAEHSATAFRGFALNSDALLDSSRSRSRSRRIANINLNLKLLLVSVVGKHLLLSVCVCVSCFCAYTKTSCSGV